MSTYTLGRDPGEIVVRGAEYKEGRPAHITEEYAEARFPGPWKLVQRMGPVESLPLGDSRGQQRAAEWPGDSMSTSRGQGC